MNSIMITRKDIKIKNCIHDKDKLCDECLRLIVGDITGSKWLQR